MTMMKKKIRTIKYELRKHLTRFYCKWFRHECWNFCVFCKHRDKCWKEFPWVEVPVTLSREEIEYAFRDEQALNDLMLRLTKETNRNEKL